MKGARGPTQLFTAAHSHGVTWAWLAEGFAAARRELRRRCPASHADKEASCAMLHADKEALRTAYKLRLLAIREKELNYFLQNCINIATLAAMLAGFAQSGLIYTKCTPRAAAASALRVPRRPARPVPKLTSLAFPHGRYPHVQEGRRAADGRPQPP